ncbi:protein yae1 [Actinidia eriantha]|uniref:protein yae1 n=1 Tax=Actinidia eriantha TaxID=165200 RepID=UPI002585E22B|nr:protein yae1 [Actinidia eriantha]XP_057496250.1 protein yae1 [Actinidia eriantha]
MDRSFADELYSETLKLSNGESATSSANQELHDLYDPKLDNLSHDDGSLWGSSPEEQNNLSDLDREWNKRHDQFHTIGYRDGLIAGKEASAQEGFNMGFKESVLVGYNWGLVRGVTSALTFLPDGLREKLIKTQEERQKFQSLYEAVHSLSTSDAMKLFHDSIMTKRSVEQSESTEASSEVEGLQDQSTNLLQNYSEELKSLIIKSPAVEVNLVVDQ